jgi:hypothetical protein
MVQGTIGVGVGVGVGAGVMLGVGVGAGVGVGVGVIGVGVGTGVEVGLGFGVGEGLTPGVGVALGDPPGVAPGLGAGVAVEAKSGTFRFTSGTESSNTLLSIVTSPEPVTSTETESVLFESVIETWACDVVTPPTVFHVRPRQSNAIASSVWKVTPSGSGIVRVSRVPSPLKSMVTT